MTGYATPPPEVRAPEGAPGSRLETGLLLLQLAGDLLSVPFHLVAFLCTRAAHRRRFRAALEAGASTASPPEESSSR